MTPEFRIGQGFDVHPWSDDPERRLVLGGVRFDDGPGLVGHSDSDVAAHACTDALLGAAGLGDIGSAFPDSDPQFAGADSVELLRQAATMVHDAGWGSPTSTAPLSWTVPASRLIVTRCRPISHRRSVLRFR